MSRFGWPEESDADVIRTLIRERDELRERIARMREEMAELHTAKLTIGAVMMRYPKIDYALNVTHVYQTPSGVVVIVAPLGAATSDTRATRPRGMAGMGIREAGMRTSRNIKTIFQRCCRSA